MIITRPIQVGLIGVGQIVERVHLPILNNLTDVTPAGIFDSNLERAVALARQYNIPNVCDSLDELLRLELDAVLVACPNNLHASSTIAALESGLHVLCEKPMATTLADAQAMLAAAKRTGQTLMIAFTNRFRPESIALHKMIQDGQLGHIRTIRCGWLRQQGVPGLGSWFTTRKQSGGGAFIDLGSHLIDLAVWYGGRPVVLDVQCLLDYTLPPKVQAGWYHPKGVTNYECDVEIGASAYMICEGPLDIFVEVNWACATSHDRTYMHITGTRGEARLETLFGLSPSGYRPTHPLYVWTEDQTEPYHIQGTTDVLIPYKKQWEFFIEKLLNRDSLRDQLYDGLTTMEIINSLYTSAKVFRSQDV